MADCCEHSNERSGSIKDEKFLEQLKTITFSERAMAHVVRRLIRIMIIINNTYALYPTPGCSSNRRPNIMANWSTIRKEKYGTSLVLQSHYTETLRNPKRKKVIIMRT
jgi:hypothetical protein